MIRESQASGGPGEPSSPPPRTWTESPPASERPIVETEAKAHTEERPGVPSTLERAPRRIWAEPLGVIFVWAVVITLALLFLRQLQIVALGFLAASAVACLLHPIARVLPGSRGWRGTIVWLAFLLVAAGLVFLTGWLTAQPIREQLAQLPHIRQDVNAVLAQWSQRLGLDEPWTIESIVQQGSQFFGSISGREVLTRTTQFTATVFVALAFVFLGSLYLLVEPRGELSDPLIRMLPPRRRAAMRAALRDIEPRLRWWLLGTLFSMIVVGLLSWVGYMIIGLRFAVPLALFMGLAELVPTLGPIAAFALALLVAFAQGTSEVIGVTVVYAVIQLLESYVLLPLVMRGAVRIPPVVTLFTVVLWGTIFGFAGFILAVPIDLTIWTFADHFVLRREGASIRAP